MDNSAENITERRWKLFHLSVMCCDTANEALQLALQAEAWIYNGTAPEPVVVPPALEPLSSATITPILAKAFGPTGRMPQPLPATTYLPGRTLNATQQKIWYAVALVISTTGYSPSYNSIASTIGVSAWTVRATMPDLIKKGYLRATGTRVSMTLHVVHWPNAVVPRESDGPEWMLEEAHWSKIRRGAAQAARDHATIVSDDGFVLPPAKTLAKTPDDWPTAIAVRTFGPIGKFDVAAAKIAPVDELNRNQLIAWHVVARMISATGYSPAAPAVGAAVDMNPNVAVIALKQLVTKGYLRREGVIRSNMIFQVERWPEGVTPRVATDLARNLTIPLEEYRINDLPTATPAPPPAGGPSEAPIKTPPVATAATAPDGARKTIIRQRPENVSIEQLIAFLNDTGRKVEDLRNGQFKVDGRVLTAMRFIAEANNIRVRQGLPIFISDVNERTVAPGSSLG